MPVSTFTWNSAPSNASVADLKAWAQGVHDALAAIGLVQTSDSGQVTISAITSVPSAGGVAGYEIWRFNDAPQATKPIFFKVEYGTGAAGSPAMWLTVGTGSNGAGTINGSNLFPRTMLGTATSSWSPSSATQYASYASGDGSAFAIALWPAWMHKYSIGGFSIERSCDNTGTYNGSAVAINTWAGVNGAKHSVVIGTTGTYDSANCARQEYCAILPAIINGVTTLQTSNPGYTLSENGETAPVFPIGFAAPGVAPWASNFLCAVAPGDAGATSVIQVATINGASRTYRAFPYNYYTGDSNSPAGGVLMQHISAQSYGRAAAFPAMAWAV